MSYVPIPDSFIHPRSNQPAKGHSGRMAEIKFFHIFKHLVDPDVRWATKNENIYKKLFAFIAQCYRFSNTFLYGYFSSKHKNYAQIFISSKVYY